MSLGAILTEGGCRFRVWAPAARTVEVQIEGPNWAPMRLEAVGNGYFEGFVERVTAGTLYRYSLDGESYPDPCSRYQPAGPHGPSMVVDPKAFPWTDEDWPGITLRGQVLYELHIGTFTPQGTFDAAAEKLEYLRALGVTTIEVMPVAEVPGRWNWGYDGVYLFAPFHRYGDYAAFQRFVDRAHRLSLGVILDVVYNHLGPDGNYLTRFSPNYFTEKYATDWGQPLNFDGPGCTGVREFFIENASEWIAAFHLDGLRLDATQSIFDKSGVHILAELVTHARAAAGSRRIVVISENEPQRATQLLPVAEGGLGIDGMWNDDFHHAARVAATGKRSAYYHDYSGRSQEFVSAVKYGFLFQGQYYHWQQQTRGETFRPRHEAVIAFLQNHDQVANGLWGERLHQMTSPARCRALTALLLLAPHTPMLFMGQEFAVDTPFLFFADHNAPLRHAVYAGRRQFLQQFPGAATPEGQAAIDDPAHETTFYRSKLDWSQLKKNDAVLQFHMDLLTLRRSDEVVGRQAEEGIDGAVLTEHAFLIRWFDRGRHDRLLLINLGVEIPPQPMAEPLLAPPIGKQWQVAWSSEDIRYGGSGAASPDTGTGWRIPAEVAIFLKAE